MYTVSCITLATCDSCVILYLNSLEYIKLLQLCGNALDTDPALFKKSIISQTKT
jgi:hypothetical protein